MKRIINTLFVSAIALATFSSCQKEVDVSKDASGKRPGIMTVNAGSFVTKTYLEEVSSTEYNIKWSEGDAIACYEVSMVEVESVLTPTIQNKVNSTALSSAAATASFEMDFSGNSGVGDFSYIFVYPASKYSKNTGENPIYRALIDKDQTFSATSFDKNADLLISKAITNQTIRPTSVDAKFERIGSTALMNIKAPNTDETIRKITFSTTEGNIQGYYKVYPLTGTHETALYSGGKSIELTPAETTPYSGTIPVWFRLAAITLSDNFKVVVETNKKTYTKEVDLATASRSIEFTNSGLTKFNVDMTAVTGVANATLSDGDYYIVAKYGTDYFALSSQASGTRLAYSQLTDFDPTASSYFGTDDNLVWTITNVEDGAITVEQGTGTYLTPAQKGASTGTTKKTYTVADGTEVGTFVLNSVQESGYGLRLNVDNNYFAFYNSSPSAKMIADMYFMPKTNLPRVSAPTNVDASASVNTIIVSWNDASDSNIDHYLVTLSGAASDSQNVAVGVESYEFTGLSDGTYTVSVTAISDDHTSYLDSEPVVVENILVGDPKGTASNPYTASEAAAQALSGNTSTVYVEGIISSIATVYNSTYHNVSFYITDDGLDTSTKFEIFRAAATSADDFKVGDWVKFQGTLTTYNNTTPETEAAPTLISQVHAPTFTPNGGSFTTSQSVSITADSGATIRYTDDGSTDPTASTGTVYSGALSLTATTTIKAIAIKDGHVTGVVSKTFTKNNGGATSTLTFASACGGSGTADDGAEWTVTSDGTESSYDSTKGIHYGTGSAQVQYIKLTTSDITGTITKVVVNASTASGVTATVDVTVDGSAFGGAAQSLTASAANYTFTGSASGEIVVTVTKPSKATKAIYVKSVAVTYE